MARPRVHFEAALDGLREQFLEIGRNVEEIIDLAVRCYFLQAPALSSDALSLSKEINRSIRDIDEILFQLLSSKQLNLADTRHLMAYIKANVLLAEVCALAVRTADSSLSFNCSRMDWPDNIPKLGASACAQVHNAIQALSDSDGGLAARVIDDAEVIALLENDAWIHLVDKMKSSPPMIEKAVSAMIIVRHFEKIANHASSIAEYVLFWMEGTDVHASTVNGSHVVTPETLQTHWRRKRSR
jgi:phosphate transport system protein